MHGKSKYVIGAAMSEAVRKKEGFNSLGSRRELLFKVFSVPGCG